MNPFDKRPVVHATGSLGLFTVFTVILKIPATVEKIVNIFPYIEPFLFPLLMGCLVASGFYAIFAIPPAIQLLLPGVRWGRKFYERCETLSFKVAPIIGFDSKAMPELMTELHQFCLDLEEYRIPYPPIFERYRVRGDNRVDSNVKLWRVYLLILRTCAKQGDLERAQNIYDELSKNDQELWDRIEETEEALADSQ